MLKILTFRRDRNIIFGCIRLKSYANTATLSIFKRILLINVLYKGPYKEYSARTEVEECDFPNNNPLQWAVNALRSQGYKVNL